LLDLFTKITDLETIPQGNHKAYPQGRSNVWPQ
jgi:hypothetical protein